MTRCRRCNRRLTDPASVRLGIGPECLEQAIADNPTSELLALRSAGGGRIRKAAINDNLTLDLFQQGEKMETDIDLATDRAEREREYRLSEIRRQVAEPQHYDNCQWCGEPTEGGAKFCDADCRDDADKQSAVDRIRGAQ